MRDVFASILPADTALLVPPKRHIHRVERRRLVYRDHAALQRLRDAQGPVYVAGPGRCVQACVRVTTRRMNG